MLDNFFDYCWGFYGPNGIHGNFFNNKLTRKELRVACAARMSHPSWGDGDTVDREAVREILFKAHGLPSGAL